MMSFFIKELTATKTPILSSHGESCALLWELGDEVDNNILKKQGSCEPLCVCVVVVVRGRKDITKSKNDGG